MPAGTLKSLGAVLGGILQKIPGYAQVATGAMVVGTVGSALTNRTLNSLGVAVKGALTSIMTSLGEWGTELLELYGLDTAGLFRQIDQAKAAGSVCMGYVDVLQSGGLQLSSAFVILAAGFGVAMTVRAARWLLGFIPTLNLS